MGNEKKHSIKEDFTMLAILLLPVSVAINVVGGQLTTILKLPIFLDTIGTILTSMLCGPWVGAVSGALTNVILGFSNPEYFPFIPVNVVTGLTAGIMANKKMFATLPKSILSVILMAVASTVVSAPIVVLVYGGATGSGIGLVAATAMAAGANIWSAFFGVDGLATVIDRLVSFFICMAVIKVIPPRTLVKFSCGNNYIKEK